MDKYGIVNGEINKIKGEVHWTVDRLEQDGSLKEYKCIEFIERKDFDNIDVLGDAKGFRMWLNQFEIEENEQP
tara:strand:- start:75 stop:293 length:219 start_codon:yes stop_codon:yes gene_type:complete